MRILPVLVVLGILVTAIPSDAQRWGGGWGGGYDGYHSSTAAEGYQRGFADVVRSAGAANLMNSKALGNIEDARSKNINNHLQATKTYFEMKRYNKEYRDANKKPRPTSEQLFRLAKEATPDGLSPAELDPVSGAINWPEALKTDTYEETRGNLEALYADRAQAGGKVDMEQYQEIRKNVRAMQAKLKGQINDIPPQVFSKTNAFLKKLEYAANLAG